MGSTASTKVWENPGDRPAIEFVRARWTTTVLSSQWGLRAFPPILWVCLIFASGCIPLWALNPGQPLNELYHTAWNAKNGLPGIVVALAQSTDGYLWVGTTDGLFRFDGVEFERYKPERGSFEANSVSALLALPNGGLWIGYLRGGASFLIHGEVTNYSAYSGREGFPLSAVRGFAQDWDGNIWAAVVGGLARLQGNRWETVNLKWSYPGRAPTAVFVDRQGTLWVADKGLVMFLPRGEKKFRNTGLRIDFRIDAFAELPDGDICFLDITHNLIKILHPPMIGPAARSPWQESSSSRLLIDRDAALWVTEEPEGLVRLPFSTWKSGTDVERIGIGMEAFTQRQGLTDNESETVLEDREGDIWVGTDGGLDRFRHRNLTWRELTGKHYFSLVAGDNGDVLAGTMPGRVLRVKDGQPVSGAPEAVWMAYRDPDGTIWFAASDGLWRLKGGRFVKIALPIQLKKLRGSSRNKDPIIISAMTRDNSGTLWVSISGLGEFQFKDGVWKFIAVLRDHPDWTARAACTDSLGRVWLVYGEAVAVIDHGQVHTFSSRDGIGIGLPNTIVCDHQQPWVGGESGVAFLRGDRFYTLVGADGQNFGLITGIVASPSNGLWLAAGPGIVHVPEGEVQKVLRNPGYRVAYDLFDLVTDLPEQLQRAGVYSSGAIEGTDGILWFATRGGVARVDPAHIEKNTLPPPVSIRAVAADGRSYPDLANVSLPPVTNTLEIDYSALSLSIPERVRFRFRLDGSKENWQDVGTRRKAFYQGLAPGDYKFQVIACNNDGVWNYTGATLMFTVLPAWYQTYWFRVLCVLSLGGLIYCAYLLRMRQYAAEMRRLFNERLDERVRIARELHDTLLQSFHGLMFQFQAARNLLPRKPDSAMQALDEAILTTEQALAEGRDAIHDLRPEPTGQTDLVELLTATGQELTGADTASGHPPGFRVTVEGKPQRLEPTLQDEVYRIGREVIRNAFRHAIAGRVEVEIRYDDHQLRLRIRDDGRGIDPKVLETSGRPGHWGLSGIRERADRIGARLKFWSESDAGTEVELVVPAAVAYEKQPHRRRSRLFHGKGGSGERS
jgi:signal transduction histidine kinase/ligand-binding sensor domain-containing protein